MNEQVDQRLPFFVYGTLLPGQPNYSLWAESVVDQKAAQMPNGRLLDLGTYPMLVEAADEGSVQGMVMTVRGEAYTAVLARLDHLEGYDPERPGESDYVRVAREVYGEEGTAVTAWVYIGQAPADTQLPVIPHGDWVSHIEHKRQQIDDWWQHIHTVAGLSSPSTADDGND